MKKLFASFLIVFAAGVLTPRAVMAQYGQYGQILGTTAPEVTVTHEPKNAGIDDLLNPRFFSLISFSVSGGLFALSTRKQKRILNR